MMIPAGESSKRDSQAKGMGLFRDNLLLLSCMFLHIPCMSVDDKVTLRQGGPKTCDLSVFYRTCLGQSVNLKMQA